MTGADKAALKPKPRKLEQWSVANCKPANSDQQPSNKPLHQESRTLKRVAMAKLRRRTQIRALLPIIITTFRAVLSFHSRSIVAGLKAYSAKSKKGGKMKIMSGLKIAIKKIIA